MRIGVLVRGEDAELTWLAKNRFQSLEWLGLADSPCRPEQSDWRAPAEEFAARAKDLGLRISAIGALYRNPLDPAQTASARAVFRRAIEVASHIGTRTVAGFPGAVIDVEWDSRGGHAVYKPFENFIPQLLAFWEPLAQFAADLGVRIAFEHCPQGAFHLPVQGYNMLGQPAMWERLFNATRFENLGIEWDASHLMCQFIDPVRNIHRFGSRIFHVHAKDAYIDRSLLETYGICHPGVAEHRMPGLGQANWPEIIHALVRAGYDSDLNIEGKHDPVFRDHSPENADKRLAGRQLENAGLLIARRTLEILVADLH